MQTPRQSVGVDAFFGGYYSHKFSGKQGDKDLDYQQDFYRNEGGLNLGAGLHFGDFKIGYNGRIALTNFTRHKNVDNAHLQNYAFYLTLTYLF